MSDSAPNSSLDSAVAWQQGLPGMSLRDLPTTPGKGLEDPGACAFWGVQDLTGEQATRLTAAAPAPLAPVQPTLLTPNNFAIMERRLTLQQEKDLMSLVDDYGREVDHSGLDHADSKAAKAAIQMFLDGLAVRVR